MQFWIYSAMKKYWYFILAILVISIAFSDCVNSTIGQLSRLYLVLGLKLRLSYFIDMLDWPVTT